MNTKALGIAILMTLGVYFLVFHAAPFPLSHNAIGLPPYHTLHSAIGMVFLALAGYWWWKK